MDGHYRLFAQCAMLLSIVCLLWGCQSTPSSEKESAAKKGSKSKIFTEKSVITHAQGFGIEYHENYKIAHVFHPFQDQPDTLSYLLLPRGMGVPEGSENLSVIRIPVENLFVLSTTHVALTAALGAHEVIKGVSNISHICDTTLRERTASGEIMEVGGEGNMNMEGIISANPGVVMASGMQAAMMKKFNVLQQAEIPVLVNSEWLESTLLARAEWIKLMGALLNKEAEANAHFDNVVQEYERLKALVLQIDPAERKAVINGIPYKGTWYVAGGNSYMARLLEDAGAQYHWSATEATGSIALDFESVYPIALEADFWFPGEFINTKEELLAKDARYADFKPLKSGNVYANNKRMCAGGGNVYWISGIVNPHLILADYIKMLYPDLLPEYALYYHKKVGSKQ